MAAELDKLGKQTEALAGQFRRNGELYLANMLHANAKEYHTQANAFRHLGGQETFQIAAVSPVAELTEDPTLELREQTLERVGGLGFRFEVIDYPNKRVTRNSRLTGVKVKPEDWFFDQIDAGTVAKDAATLKDTQVIIESAQKPSYRDGRQMYYEGNDPLGPMLMRLRQEGKIAVPSWARSIPSDSRFGVSPREIDTYVIPAFAELIGVDPSQVSLPREIEFNYAGNLRHPEWGETNTWEWLADHFADASRLVGGNSGDGGLANVDYGDADDRGGGAGFRLQVGFSSKA
jgi:hypothetical protein